MLYYLARFPSLRVVDAFVMGRAADDFKMRLSNDALKRTFQRRLGPDICVRVNSVLWPECEFSL